MANTTRVNVFWDESAQLIDGTSGFDAVSGITTISTSFGSLTEFRVYTDPDGPTAFITSILSQLQASGVSILHVAGQGREGAAAKMMLSDAFVSAFCTSLPSVLVFVTADPDILYGLSTMKAHNIQTVIITPPSSHGNLLHVASSTPSFLQVRTRQHFKVDFPSFNAIPFPFHFPVNEANGEKSQKPVSSGLTEESGRSTPAAREKDNKSSIRGVHSWKGKTKSAISSRGTSQIGSPPVSRRSSRSILSDHPIRQSFVNHDPSLTPSPVSRRSDFVLVSQHPNGEDRKVFGMGAGAAHGRISPSFSIVSQARPKSVASSYHGSPEDEVDQSQGLPTNAITNSESAKPTSSTTSQTGLQPVVPLVMNSAAPEFRPTGALETILNPQAQKSANLSVTSGATPTLSASRQEPHIPARFQLLVDVLRRYRGQGITSIPRNDMFRALQSQKKDFIKECGLTNMTQPVAKYLRAAFDDKIITASHGDVVLHADFYGE